MTSERVVRATLAVSSEPAMEPTVKAPLGKRLMAPVRIRTGDRHGDERKRWILEMAYPLTSA